MSFKTKAAIAATGVLAAAGVLSKGYWDYEVAQDDNPDTQGTITPGSIKVRLKTALAVLQGHSVIYRVSFPNGAHVDNSPRPTHMVRSDIDLYFWSGKDLPEKFLPHVKFLAQNSQHPSLFSGITDPYYTGPVPPVRTLSAVPDLPEDEAHDADCPGCKDLANFLEDEVPECGPDCDGCDDEPC